MFPDTLVEEFFRQYVLGFMWHDVEATIKAKANYGAALMLMSYTEALGGLSDGTLGVLNGAGVRFRHGLSLMKWKGDAAHYSMKFLLTEGSGAPKSVGLWEVFRCGLAHEYFAKGLVTVINDDGPENPRAVGADLPGIGWCHWQGKEKPTSLGFFTNAFYRDLRDAFDALKIAVLNGTRRTHFETAITRIWSRKVAKVQ